MRLLRVTKSVSTEMTPKIWYTYTTHAAHTTIGKQAQQNIVAGDGDGVDDGGAVRPCFLFLSFSLANPRFLRFYFHSEFI